VVCEVPAGTYEFRSVWSPAEQELTDK
jgi:hypothetical protein